MCCIDQLTACLFAFVSVVAKREKLMHCVADVVVSSVVPTRGPEGMHAFANVFCAVLCV